MTKITQFVMPKMSKITHDLLCKKCRKSRYFCGRILARNSGSRKIYEEFHGWVVFTFKGVLLFEVDLNFEVIWFLRSYVFFEIVFYFDVITSSSLPSFFRSSLFFISSYYFNFPWDFATACVKKDHTKQNWILLEILKPWPLCWACRTNNNQIWNPN